MSSDAPASTLLRNSNTMMLPNSMYTEMKVPFLGLMYRSGRRNSMK